MLFLSSPIRDHLFRSPIHAHLFRPNHDHHAHDAKHVYIFVARSLDRDQLEWSPSRIRSTEKCDKK
jgi:hypothetical protein